MGQGPDACTGTWPHDQGPRLMAWDLARGAREEPASDRGVLAFAGKALQGVPTRRLGRIQRSDNGSLVFRARPWVVLPAKSHMLESSTLFAVEGALYPSLVSDPEGRSGATLDLPPRSRGTCTALVDLFDLKGTGTSWLQRQAESAKSGVTSLGSRLRSSWSVLAR